MDFKLRGILTVINDNKIFIKNEDGSIDAKLFTNYILPQLHFYKPEDFNVVGLKEKIADFLTSDKIKFKLYNAMFPHPQMELKKGTKETRLNKFYLQNMSRYHNKYLEALYSGKVSSPDDLYKIAVECIVKSSKKAVSAERLLNLSFDKAAKGKKTEEDKATKEKKSEEDKLYEKYDKAARFEHSVADRYFKCYQMAIEQNMVTTKEAKALYDSYINKLEAYGEHSEAIRKQKIIKIEQFIKLFIDEFKELNEDLKYNFSIKNYIADIGAANSLIFTQKFKQILMRIIKGENIKVTYIENTKSFSCKVNIKTKQTNKAGEKVDITIEKLLSDKIIQDQRHTVSNTRDTFAKIGRMVCDGVDKNIRVALGIAIIDYIYTTSMRITERSKLPKKTVYIDFDMNSVKE
jgi:hypothetical protein